MTSVPVRSDKLRTVQTDSGSMPPAAGAIHSKHRGVSDKHDSAYFLIEDVTTKSEPKTSSVKINWFLSHKGGRRFTNIPVLKPTLVNTCLSVITAQYFNFRGALFLTTCGLDGRKYKKYKYKLHIFGCCPRRHHENRCNFEWARLHADFDSLSCYSCWLHEKI